MKISLLVLGFVFFLASHAICVEESLEKIYELWNLSIQKKLDEGKSWIFLGSEQYKKDLAKEVPKNLKFFELKLKENMFLVKVLDESELGNIFNLVMGSVPIGSLQEKQKKLLSLLAALIQWEKLKQTGGEQKVPPASVLSDADHSDKPGQEKTK